MLLIIKKIFLIVCSIKRSNIIFKNPPRRNIVIFDVINKSELKNILQGKKAFFLSDFNRVKNIEKIYISIPVLKETIRQIFKGNFKICYYVAIINIVKPKTLLTLIDNNFTFYKISKFYKNKIKCIAIQNAWRDLNEFKKKQIREIYLDQFICYGPQTKSHYLSKGARVSKFHFFGSLRQSNAEKYFNRKKIKFHKKKKYDLCLIESLFSVLDKDTKIKTAVKNKKILGFKTLLSHFLKISEEFNLNSIILLKSTLKEDYKKELKFYQNHMPKNCKVRLIKRKNSMYSSYHYSYNSKIVIGKSSSLLLENFCKNHKILSCAFISRIFTKHPFLNPLFEKSSIVSLQSKSYHLFKKKVLNLLNMGNKDYTRKIKKLKKFMISYDNANSTINSVRGLLN